MTLGRARKLTFEVQCWTVWVLGVPSRNPQTIIRGENLGECLRGNTIGATGPRASERESASERVSERLSEREVFQRFFRGF